MNILRKKSSARFVCRWLLLAAVSAALLAGCAKRKDLCPCAADEQQDEGLMLVLSSARALHHQADLYLDQGEVDSAVAAIRRILELNLDPKWPEAEEVRLDAVSRLAKLLLGQDKEQEALNATDQALAQSKRDSFYLSNLYSVRGEILEHRVERLKKDGQEQEAKQVARQAITDYEKSIAINKRLQRELLKGKQP